MKTQKCVTPRHKMCDAQVHWSQQPVHPCCDSFSSKILPSSPSYFTWWSRKVSHKIARISRSNVLMSTAFKLHSRSISRDRMGPQQKDMRLPRNTMMQQELLPGVTRTRANPCLSSVHQSKTYTCRGRHACEVHAQVSWCYVTVGMVTWCGLSCSLRHWVTRFLCSEFWVLSLKRT